MTVPLHDLPDISRIADWLGDDLLAIARSVEAAGGRMWLVGGAVRDLLMGNFTHELDFEIRGIGLDSLRSVLGEYGEVLEVGRSFGVLRLRHLDADFALPRRDSRDGPGHRGIRAKVMPDLDPSLAARRRDLTVNAISLDPLNAELLDPLDGCEALREGRLSACDPDTFGDDPLRALRVMQLAARLTMTPDAGLVAICSRQNLGELSGERIFGEFRKLLLYAAQPSIGLDFLAATGLLRFFPSLEALVGVAQDPGWHPEGDVWQHTLLVVDQAARMRRGHYPAQAGEVDENEAEDLALMFGALCHDLGKPTTTFVDTTGRVRSPAHDIAGEKLVDRTLRRMSAPKLLTARVRTLTREHLCPAVFYEQKSGDRAWRRLARRLARSRTSMDLLARLARADHFGRGTPQAVHERFPAGDHFLERAHALELDPPGIRDVVRGRDLIARGMRPGTEFGKVLEACRRVQDETGWTDPERILEEVLARRG